jgi:peptidoglycan/LPS O-acetylase OafA/YrhL
MPGHRSNNIDIARLALATLVYVWHYGWIFPDSPVPRQILAIVTGDGAQRCVQAFFVLSGYLMYLSLEHSGSILYFFEKRFRRIYPAYFVVICLSAFFGIWFSSLSLREYMSSDSAKYILWNLAFLNFMHPTLPGVFVTQPLHFVNGPLWTLKIEVAYYVLFPLIFAIGKFVGFTALFFALYCLSVIYHTWMSELASQSGLHIYEVLATQLPGQLAYFVAGSAVASWTRGHTERYSWSSTGAIVLAVIGLWFSGPSFLLPMLLAAFILSFCFLAPKLGGWPQYGDVSYGIYIIHFPVLQAIRSAGVLQHRQGLLFIPATIIIFTLSFMMWRLVESPALKGRWTKRAISSERVKSSRTQGDLCFPNLSPTSGATLASKNRRDGTE